MKNDGLFPCRRLRNIVILETVRKESSNQFILRVDILCTLDVTAFEFVRESAVDNHPVVQHIREFTMQQPNDLRETNESNTCILLQYRCSIDALDGILIRMAMRQ